MNASQSDAPKANTSNAELPSGRGARMFIATRVLESGLLQGSNIPGVRIALIGCAVQLVHVPDVRAGEDRIERVASVQPDPMVGNQVYKT